MAELLIFMTVYSKQSITGYSHFTPHENDRYLCPSMYCMLLSMLGVLCILCYLSCTLEIMSCRLHFSKEKIKA